MNISGHIVFRFSMSLSPCLSVLRIIWHLCLHVCVCILVCTYMFVYVDLCPLVCVCVGRVFEGKEESARGSGYILKVLLVLALASNGL